MSGLSVIKLFVGCGCREQNKICHFSHKYAMRFKFSEWETIEYLEVNQLFLELDYMICTQCGGGCNISLEQTITIRKYGEHTRVQMVCNKMCILHVSRKTPVSWVFLLWSPRKCPLHHDRAAINILLTNWSHSFMDSLLHMNLTIYPKRCKYSLSDQMT